MIQAPQLNLKLRLTQSNSEGSRNKVTLFNAQNTVHRQTHSTPDKVEFTPPPLISLTPQEEVIIKDVWKQGAGI